MFQLFFAIIKLWSQTAQVRTVHENLTKTTNKLVLMQCTSAYPTNPADVNLRVSKHAVAWYVLENTFLWFSSSGAGDVSFWVPSNSVRLFRPWARWSTNFVLATFIHVCHGVYQTVTKLMLRCLNRGVAITLAAIDLGASVIERHFTLDRHQVN